MHVRHKRKAYEVLWENLVHMRHTRKVHTVEILDMILISITPLSNFAIYHKSTNYIGIKEFNIYHLI